jgi:hypothetical protein
LISHRARDGGVVRVRFAGERAARVLRGDARCVLRAVSLRERGQVFLLALQLDLIAYQERALVVRAA